MKKLFLTLAMFLFAFTGVMRADEVTIGSLDGASNNAYLPMNSLYEYSYSQQIYTAEEIGTNGTISAITVWLVGNANLYEMPFNIFMKEVDNAEFASTSDWIAVTAADMVYTGSVTVHNTEAEAYTFTLDTPFSYSGEGNLMIAFNNTTGQWKSGLNGKAFGANTDPKRAIYARRDGTAYDPYDMSGISATATTYMRNVITLTMGGGTPSGPVNADLITEPDVLNLGYRPIGEYWVEPYTFLFKSVDANANINQVINGSNAYMTVNLDTPVLVELNGEGVEATITTGNGFAGEVTEQFAVDFTGTRALKTFSMTATAYEPVEGDLFELAQEVTIPYTGTAPDGIYRNYTIAEDEAEEAIDAVYKLTLEEASMITVSTTGANAVAKLYTEDFNGQPGPMVDNYYEYGISGSTPADVWFEGYEYTGNNTWFGTSAGGGFIFGYKVTPETLSGYGYCYLTQVEAAAREAYPYNLYVLRGGDTPADAEMIYYQEMDGDPEPQSFFTMDVDQPFTVGEDENLWVFFYSASPYAGYSGKDPVDTENGKIWYSVDGTTWYSNTTYTPVIYLHLEYPAPEGKGEVVLNLADMSIQHFNNAGTVAESEGTVTMPVHKNTIVAQPQTRGNVINNMFVPAGTYYLVMASTDQNFPVNITKAEVPAPGQATIIAPEDGALGVNNGDTFQWELGEYTDEFQIILGTQFPPTDILVDWTNNLFQSMPLTGLQHNKTYFAQINARNGSGTTMGEIIGFTTVIDGTSNFAVENANLYPGDDAVFTWDPVSRSLQGYNIYKDGELVNETPITEATYAVGGLEYNMEGYNFQLSVVYDEGESTLTDPVLVKMTGNGTVSGYVYDTDEDHPVANIPVTLIVVDEYQQLQNHEATTDENGFYTTEVLAGMCIVGISQENGEAHGYATAIYYDPDTNIPYVMVAYEGVYENVNIITHEYYYPLGMINATEEEDGVLVEWDWTPAEVGVDFETGDFSQADFVLPATYPWAITTTNPYEGTYCMKSTCEGVASASSSIEVNVNVPYEAGKMGFYVRVSSESNYDKFHFYIDGVEQGQALSGQADYVYKEYSVEGGNHTYKWEYTKDSSVNSNDDCIYVDNITLYRQDVPLPPTPGATTYNFDDGTMMNWSSIDADGDGNGWVSSSNPGIYHNSGVSLSGTGHNGSEAYVISGSYANQTGQALTPDNYLVSPTQISAQDGAQISFYACAQDASYAAEHFGVSVSTTTATASAFTTVQEWTLTAKGTQGRTDESEFDIRGTRAQGNWYQYTVDLSSYAGQDIWVAIRHFNCTDMFILNVDDIALADGSAKAFAAQTPSNRSLQSFNLYRRNVYTDSVAVPVANELASDVYSYLDEAYANLPYGIYEWGIQAYYEGVADTRGEVVIGEGATTNGYLPTYTYYNYSLTEQIYTADELGSAGNISSVSFFNQGSERTRNIAVYMVNTDKTSFADGYDWVSLTSSDKVFEGEVTFATNEWTTINFSNPFAYSGGNMILGVDDNTGTWESAASFSADNTENVMALRIYNDNTNFDPSAPSNYSGGALSVRNQIKLQTTGGGGGGGGGITDGLSEILWSNAIEKDMYSEVTVYVSLNNGQSPAGATVALGNYTATVDETAVVVFESVLKGDYVLTASMPEFNSYTENVVIDDATETFNVVLNENVGPVEDLYVSSTGWAKWAGTVPGGGGTGPTPPPTPGQGQWYYYGDDVQTTGVGAGAAFYWAVMFPTGSYTGNMVTKVANFGSHDDTYGTNGAFNGSVTIYNDGTNTPANAVGTMDITMPDTDQLVEFEFPTPVTIDPTKNLWIVFYNSNSTDYVGSCCNDSGDPNGRWVSLDGSSWMDLATAGVPGYNWMIRAYVASGSKENVVSILDPMKPISNPGTLACAPAKATRGALSYKVMVDGNYEGETVYPYFQHNVDGFEAGSEHTTSVAAIYATGMGDWVDYTWTYTPCDEYSGATDVAAVQDGSNVNITWTIPGGSGPTPPPTPGQTYDFEDGTMQGWTSLDADGDGYNWAPSTQFGGHNGSTGIVYSQSYDNNFGILYPDNYLVSPSKAECPSIKFYACAQDASYAAEHFGVAVSTTTASASAFTMVQEWTMTAKDGGQATSVTRSGNRAQGNWYEYNVDLSAYSGQEILVAIRHFNCSDMFYLNVDDIELGGGGSTPPTPPTPPTGNTFDFEDGTLQGWTALDADGDGYNWAASTQFGGHSGSTGIVYSQSYDNNFGILYPDNYLVSPSKAACTGISFWACAQDASYAAEHFGVAVSTTTATASAFTMVQEWTMTAKGNGQPTSVTRSGNRAQGTWYQYTVDLSAYAGQDIYVAIRHFNCSDMFYLDVDDITLGDGSKGRDMWDLVYSFGGTSAGQQAVASDGQYIYTASWQTTPTGGYTFYKYDLQGNFIEGFEIAGATGIRDLTTDGDYFYGTSGSTQIFILDFTNKTLVGTINCSGLTSRHISYDPERDGFWSGNWSTLALYSRTGALIQNGPAPTSAYGSAYYKDADNVEHLYLFCQPDSDAKVYDYNITTGTLGTDVVFDFAATPGFDGIAGGSFIGDYNGTTCWFGNSQQDPNLIGIYELAGGGSTPPTPPTPPSGDILGAYVFRDGELISGIEPITTGSFVDNAPATGEYEYCVRVVYSDYSMSCPTCVTADYECIPVNNLNADYTYNGANDYGVTLSWQCAQAAYVQFYEVYYGDVLAATVPAPTTTYYVEMTENPGNYTFGVVANYGYCESEMVTADVNVTSVDELASDVVIYPNPTNGNVKIEAAEMNHITVVNSIGQVVFDADVDGDMFQMNLGQYNTGLYLIRVSTANGVSVKRVTVVK